jgi:hypothetical protein
MSLLRSEQRRIWLSKGLCGACGKEPRWTNEKGKLVSECERHFKYFRRKARKYATRSKRKPEVEKPAIIVGNKTNKGAKMTTGSGWKLVATKGKQRTFSASLIKAVPFGSERVAIFKVRK